MSSYPGRIICCGLDHSGQPLALYALTARSEASKARRLTIKKGALWVEPTDSLLGGDPELLYYRAAFIDGKTIFIANGRHSEHLKEGISLEEALESESYEPDEPIYTPRIAAAFNVETMSYHFALLARSSDGSTIRSYYSYDDLQVGYAHQIQTYSGSSEAISPFVGLPIEVNIPRTLIAQTLFDHLDPELRIALAVIRPSGYEILPTIGG